MVQNGPDVTEQVNNTTTVKAEDIAVAAIFSAVGAAVPEIVKNPTMRWIFCAGIGLCIGIYGANMYIDLSKKSGEA